MYLPKAHGCAATLTPNDLNPFSSVRRQWRPPLFLPDSANRTPMVSEQRDLKIGLGEAGNKVRVIFFVGNTA